MAKKIYMTDDDIKNIVDELRCTLSKMKCYGSIDIKRSFKTDDRAARICFTPTAWAKMTTLVARYNTEVQWHGLVRRISEFEFEVYDIIVPPHEVTGTTVVSDYKPYSEWLNSLDDETFTSVKFHGHSHVNMSVSPSGTDEKYRLDLVTQLPKPVNGMDVFYIFFIINKSHEWSAEIYDFTNNALYATSDIAIDTIFDKEGHGLEEYIAEAKKVVISRTQAASSSGYSRGSYVGYSDYYGGTHKRDENQPTRVTPISQTGNTKTEKCSPAPKSKDKKSGKSGGFKSWKDYYDKIGDTDDMDEEDDPTSPFYVKEWGYN